MIEFTKLETAIDSIKTVQCILLKLDGGRNVTEGNDEMYSVLARILSDASGNIEAVLQQILGEEKEFDTES